MEPLSSRLPALSVSLAWCPFAGGNPERWWSGLLPCLEPSERLWLEKVLFCFFFFFKLPFFFPFFFIGGKLLYNILLISTKHQDESATGIHMSLPSWILPPHLATHPTSLSYHRSLSWAPCIIQQIPTCYLFLHMVMYLFPCCSLNLSHPFLPPVSTMSSLCLCLHCCRANRLISTIFLDLCLCFFCL